MSLTIDSTVGAPSGVVNGNFPGNSWSHTVGATANLLIVTVTISWASSNNSGVVTGLPGSCTYNGSAMVQLFSTTSGNSSSGGIVEAYYLINPSTGTHAVNWTNPHQSTNCECDAQSISFIGANTSTQPDASQTSDATGVGSGTSFSLTCNGVVGEYVVGCALMGGAASPTLAITSGTAVVNNPSTGQLPLRYAIHGYKTSPVSSPGTQTMTFTSTVSQTGIIGCMLTVKAAPASSNGNFLAFI